VTQVRKRNKSLNRFVNLLKNFIGSVQIICGYELPDFLKVCDPHPGKEKTRSSAAAVFAFVAKKAKGFISVDSLRLTVCDLVIAAVQSCPDLRELGEIACHGIFNQIVGSAACGSGELVKTRLGFRL
jgi:hypothetical protein